MRNYKGEQGYLALIADTLYAGAENPDRTDVGACYKFSAACLEFNYEDPSMYPLFSVRPAPTRMAFEEFWHFLRGITDTKPLEEKGIFFWKDQTSREWLDARGLHSLPEGDMGKTYGYQLRNFGGVDQIRNIYEELKSNSMSRRHIASMWNPPELPEAALPPCWMMHQFVVRNGELDLVVYSRSADLICGTKFNVQQYAMYHIAMAKAVGLELGTLDCVLADPHIYVNHLAYAHEMLTRDTYNGGKQLSLVKDINSFEDFLNIQWEDWDVANKVNKKQFLAEPPKMAI